jgi:hypothetical protein
MALTSVTVTAQDDIPKVLGTATFSTSSGNGFTFTKTDFPATWVTLYSDNDFYFHQSDSQAVAAMQKVPAGTFYPFQVGKTRSIYCITASGSAVVVVTKVSDDG